MFVGITPQTKRNRKCIVFANFSLVGRVHRLRTMRFGGRDMRLTDVHGRVMREWLA